MLTKHMGRFQAIHYLRAQLGVPSLNDLELVSRIKRELIRKRREIDAMKTGKRKKKAIEAYAELLMTMELGDLSQGRAHSL